MKSVRSIVVALVVAITWQAAAPTLWAQSFGLQLYNNLMPASGGMGGTSIAAPQDLVSAINGNPGSITQFHGTQFTIGGAFAGPTFNLNQTGNTILPGLTPFSAKSSQPGAALPNLGVTQELSAWACPSRWEWAWFRRPAAERIFAACRAPTAPTCR